MIDADGTIYQTLDLVERAFHAEEANSTSVGVEICNRGRVDRNEWPKLPAEYRTRPTRFVTINGEKHEAYEFRPEQYDAIVALTRTLLRVFPKIKPIVPEQPDGQVIMDTLADPLAFAGILGHLHVDLQRQKWDPGALDFKRILRALNGFEFPVQIRSFTEIPRNQADLLSARRGAFFNAEERASGFFPIAAARLWHSGVHLRAARESPVRAPTRGRIIAARRAEAGAAESFALLRAHPPRSRARRRTPHLLFADRAPGPARGRVDGGQHDSLAAVAGARACRRATPIAGRRGRGARRARRGGRLDRQGGDRQPGPRAGARDPLRDLHDRSPARRDGARVPVRERRRRRRHRPPDRHRERRRRQRRPAARPPTRFGVSFTPAIWTAARRCGVWPSSTATNGAIAIRTETLRASASWPESTRPTGASSTTSPSHPMCSGRTTSRRRPDCPRTRRCTRTTRSRSSSSWRRGPATSTCRAPGAARFVTITSSPGAWRPCRSHDWTSPQASPIEPPLFGRPIGIRLGPRRREDIPLIELDPTDSSR